MRIIFIILMLIEVNSAATYEEDSKSLRSILLLGRDPLAPPSSTVNVSLTLHMLGINSLDLNEEVLTATGWLTVAWESGMSWNPGSYVVHYLHIKPDEIWRPDLVIENTATQTEILSDEQVRFRLAYSGRVTWELPVKLNVHCHLNLKLYPMDEQTCGMAISSWSYSNDEVILHAASEKTNLELFTMNSEWNVEDVAQRDAKFHNVTTLGHTYSKLTFYVTMARNSSFFGLHLILPLILLSGLMSLMFILPAQTGEKIGYSVTAYLTNVVLYVSLSFYLPLSTVGVSIIGTYYTAILCWDTVAVLLTFIVTHVYNCTSDMSKPSKAILTMMKRLTCKTSRQDITSTTLSQGTDSTSVSAHDLHACSTLPNGDVKGYKRHGRLSPINRRIFPSELIESTTTTTTNHSSNTELNNEHDSACADLEADIPNMPLESTRHRKVGPILKKEKINEPRECRTIFQWNEMACCLDVIFFVVFIFASFVIHLVFIIMIFT